MRFGIPDAALKIRFWTVSFVKNLGCHGKCDAPDAKQKQISLRSTLRGNLLLDTAIHEQLHAAMWSLDEQFVDRLATQMANNLWKIRDRIFDVQDGVES